MRAPFSPRLAYRPGEAARIQDPGGGVPANKLQRLALPGDNHPAAMTNSTPTNVSPEYPPPGGLPVQMDGPGCGQSARRGCPTFEAERSDPQSCSDELPVGADATGHGIEGESEEFRGGARVRLRRPPRTIPKDPGPARLLRQLAGPAPRGQPRARHDVQSATHGRPSEHALERERVVRRDRPRWPIQLPTG